MSKKSRAFIAVVCTLVLGLTSKQAFAWSSEHVHQSFPIEVWFGFLELPFLIVCIYYSFKTAVALKGGIFGKGLMALAWGFLVMAVGHLAMQVHHIFHFDVFRDTLGHVAGSILWFIALMITWGLSAYGFYSMYRVSKRG